MQSPGDQGGPTAGGSTNLARLPTTYQRPNAVRGPRRRREAPQRGRGGARGSRVAAEGRAGAHKTGALPPAAQPHPTASSPLFSQIASRWFDILPWQPEEANLDLARAIPPPPRARHCTCPPARPSGPGAVEVGAVPPVSTTDESKSRAKLENGEKVVAEPPVGQVEEPISRTRGKEKGQ